MLKTVTVLTPVAVQPLARGELAARIADLTGLRVGLLDNGKPNVALLLDRIEAGLRERFALGHVIYRRKIHGERPEGYIDELATHCDLVVNGVAD
ncbi:MAG: hypothetical protein M5U01_37015 [Ardenticatenaceae bacterium]|nr:hypothetical protein [Ardenticatenaceae bacterium]HBY95915.1 hypothetical protein [Chloroflexota bacterium]